MSDTNNIEQGTPARMIFFQKLHSMICNEATSGCIEWSPDGKSFIILIKDRFTNEVLPRYFGKAKFTSFSRRLKRWGFKRGDGGAYYHEQFHRNLIFEDNDDEPMFDFSSSSATNLNLPLKKRKWSPSSSPQEERREDVMVMPQMMREINRQKRVEKKQALNHPRSIDQGNTMNQGINADQRLLSTQDLAAARASRAYLNNSERMMETSQQVRHRVNPASYSSHIPSDRMSQQHPNPLYNAYTNLERRVVDEMLSRENEDTLMRSSPMSSPHDNSGIGNRNVQPRSPMNIAHQQMQHSSHIERMTMVNDAIRRMERDIIMQRDSPSNGRGSHQWPPGHGGMNPDTTRSFEQSMANNLRHTQPSLSTAQLERMRMEHEIEQARFQLLDQARSLERIRQSQRQMDIIHYAPSQQLQRNEEMMMLAAELRRRERLRQMSSRMQQDDVSAKYNEKQQSQLMISSNPVMPNRQPPQKNAPFNPAA